MKYIPYFALKLLAYMLHRLYSLIFPKYAKHGHRKITIPQKLTIITLKEAFSWSYRDIPFLVNDIGPTIGIDDLTTFQNFSAFKKKLETGLLQSVAELTAAIVLVFSGALKRPIVILIDSTGFQIMDASSYYLNRAQRKADFAKLHVAMDMGTKAMLVATPTDRYVHDIKPFKNYFVKGIKRMAKMLGFRIKAVSADSAYASEDTYRMIWRELGAIAAVKPKKTRGVPRRGELAKVWQMRNLPWFKRYSNMRWVLEGVFKIFKRLFKGYVKSKTPEERGKELVAKVIVWNMLILAKQALNTKLLAIGI